MPILLLIVWIYAIAQIREAVQYYPQSIRSGRSAQDKMAIGNIPLSRMIRNLVSPTVEPVDGVFGPEAMTFIGIPALFCLLAVGWSPWWVILSVSILLGLGKHTLAFRWTHAFHLRIPARYSYFISLSLAMLSIAGFALIPARYQGILLLFQMISLILQLPGICPMVPYVQRWDRPLRVFSHPIARFLSSQEGRVSGLPYPLRTGQINHIHTLGYNGGSQAVWMARFRGDRNPNGSGAHDWFLSAEDSDRLDWYGVRWAYSYRPLSGRWKPTQFSHLYENAQWRGMPTWRQIRDGYKLP